jgi:hypothetical protein
LAIRSALPAALTAYAAASLFHHAHNAEFLDQYPHMPAWLSPAGVYAAWLVATAIGLIGYWLRRRGLVIAYACYGLFALAHYALAPVSAHTLVMNLSIWLEAATAAVLLAVASQRRTE